MDANIVTLEEGLRRAKLPVTVRFSLDPMAPHGGLWFIRDTEAGYGYIADTPTDAHHNYLRYVRRAAARVAQL